MQLIRTSEGYVNLEKIASVEPHGDDGRIMIYLTADNWLSLGGVEAEAFLDTLHMETYSVIGTPKEWESYFTEATTDYSEIF